MSETTEKNEGVKSEDVAQATPSTVVEKKVGIPKFSSIKLGSFSKTLIVFEFITIASTYLFGYLSGVLPHAMWVNVIITMFVRVLTPIVAITPFRVELLSAFNIMSAFDVRNIMIGLGVIALLAVILLGYPQKYINKYIQPKGKWQNLTANVFALIVLTTLFQLLVTILLVVAQAVAPSVM